jgi:glycosyltransferase involved in cell wall biosynthesis
MKIAYLVKTFPKLSETFILNEILELEHQGLELHIFSLRQPSETKVHPGVAEIRAPVTYIRSWYTPLPSPPERVPFEKLAHKVQMREERRFMFLHHPIWFLRTWLLQMRHGGRKRFFHRAFQEKSGTRKRYFYQALALARELRRGGFKHLHAHFANEPTSVGELARRLAGCRFSFTAHAKDIYLTEREELAQKMAAANFVVTCTGFNRKYLQEIARGRTPIHLCYHGVDLSRFSSEPGERKDHPAMPLILSVGRFCEKKGFEYLIQACHRLKQESRRFVCRIVGFGPLQAQLEALITELDLQNCVFLVGKMTQDRLIQEYRRADVFVLPCVVTDDGDRDGIPNVLVEAMAMRIPVVSTSVSGIVELVDHMDNGLLTPEKDFEALTAAIEMLLDDAGLRERLGLNARQRVMAGFSLDQSTAKLRCLLVGAGVRLLYGQLRIFRPGRVPVSRPAPKKDRQLRTRFWTLSEEAPVHEVPAPGKGNATRN